MKIEVRGTHGVIPCCGMNGVPDWVHLTIACKSYIFSLYLLCRKKEATPSSSLTDLSQFSVAIDPTVIERMKTMPSIKNCLENLNDSSESDSSSVISSRSDDPGLPVDTTIQVNSY